MGRSPCCSKEGLNRGAWTALEDRILTGYISAHGEGKWRNLPKRAGLKRCGKSCRLRWLNYLRPDIKRGNISHDEEELIIRLHKLLGNRWSLIAGRLPGRTDNEIKNYWNTTLGKKANNAQPSSPPSKHSSQSKYSKAKNQANEPETTKPLDSASSAATKPQVVRAKASRCTAKVLVPTLSLPNENYALNSSAAIVVDPLELQFQDQNNLVNNQPQEPADSEMHCRAEEQFQGTHSQGCKELNFSYDCDEFGASNGEAEKWENFNNLSFEEPMFNDFAASCLGDDNADLGLDSLQFLLDCEEWPTDI